MKEALAAHAAPVMSVSARGRTPRVTEHQWLYGAQRQACREQGARSGMVQAMRCERRKRALSSTGSGPVLRNRHTM